MRFRLMQAIALAAVFCLSFEAIAQQSVTVDPYMATLDTDSKSIKPGVAITFDIFVMDSTTMAASKDLSVTATLTMPSMAEMTMELPKVSPGDKPGHFTVKVTFPHAGDYVLALSLKAASGKPISLAFKLKAGSVEKADMSSMAGMKMDSMHMTAALGGWPASREGSGTSWQPDASPMFMKMLPQLGGFDLSAMGAIQAGYVDPGSKRVSAQTFSNSMFMLMGQRETGGGTLGLDFMTSLDPIFNGERGVPNLFQTGETAHGIPLVDRQHPHNIFSELAGSYSHPLGPNWSGFVYGGPVGEPALGNVMFMHRASGMEIPEAPISHHWFDSTHISFGVATVGLVYQNRWKFEGSAFNGHEPGENRYTIGPLGLNSGSGRISFNPGKEWSFSSSYGYLSSPEALSPGVNEHRATVSAAYSHEFSSGDNIAVTAYLGQNFVEGTPGVSNGWLVEATYYHAKDAYFTRFERVDKDELYNVPAGNYAVDKLLLGDVHNFYGKDGFEYGLGAYAGIYSFPSSLDSYYGKSPLTIGVFLRIRPSKM